MYISIYNYIIYNNTYKHIHDQVHSPEAYIINSSIDNIYIIYHKSNNTFELYIIIDVPIIPASSHIILMIPANILSCFFCWFQHQVMYDWCLSLIGLDWLGLAWIGFDYPGSYEGILPYFIYILIIWIVPIIPSTPYVLRVVVNIWIDLCTFLYGWPCTCIYNNFEIAQGHYYMHIKT